MRSKEDEKLYAEFFDTLTEREIRKRQRLCQIQIGMAHEQKNDKALERLRAVEEDLMQAMLRRC